MYRIDFVTLVARTRDLRSMSEGFRSVGFDDKAFETPIDGRGTEMDRGRAGAQDGDDVDARDETADDRLRNGPALARRTGIPIDDRDIVVAAGCMFEIERSRSRQDATLHEDSPPSCAATDWPCHRDRSDSPRHLRMVL